MATRRHRNNKNKKVGKKRIGRTRKHRSSSRRMRGGIPCTIDSVNKNICTFPFVKENIYTDTDNIEYTFKELSHIIDKTNANGLLETTYIFKTDDGLDRKYSNKPDDVIFLNKLIAKS